MADKNFGVKKLDIIGSGTPTIANSDGGDLNINAATSTFNGNLTIAKNNAVIELSDPDSSDANYQLRNDNGTFDIKDSTNSTVKIRATSSSVTVFPNLNANNGLDVMGTITGDGNLDIADSVRHSGDVNTKITFPANDTISFDTAGTERLRIMSGGAIGIHTTTGTNTISIGGAAGLGVKFHNFTSGNSSYITVESGDKLQSNVGGTGYYTWVTGGAEKMRLANNGRLGIGSQTPQAKLDVSAGAVVVNSFLKTDSGKSYIEFEHNAGATYNTRFGSATLGAGNVGFIFETGLASDRLDAMVIDRFGKVGINTTTPNTALEVKGDITISNANNQADIFFGEHGDVADSKALIRMDQASSTAGELQFHTEDSGTLRERVKFESNGTVIFRGSSVNTQNTEYEFLSSNISPYLRLNHTANNANHTFIQFRAAGTSIGQIKDDGDGSITYDDTSDYRLKENVVDLTDAITRLKNLKPRRFNFKVSPSYTKDGFLAHELQEVVPEAVQGTKDEIVTETSKANNPSLSDMEVGDPVYQTVDRGRVVPLLTAALQEAITEIEILKAKVAALEGS